MTNNIIYIGNDGATRTNYYTAMESLYLNLTSEGYTVKKASSKKNTILRLLDMITIVIKFNKWADFVLIDTFSTYSFYYVLIISNLCRLLKIKYIPILHGGNLPSRLETSKKFSKSIFSNSHCNVAPSGYLQDEFSKRGYDVILIPNTIDLKPLQFIQRKSIKPRLLYVRAFAEMYNPQLAIKVLKHIKNHYKNASLCMVGPDKDGTLNQVKELIEAYGLNDSVEITGTLDRHEWYRKSKEYDIFINTTNIDNTPVSVIEAMALGLTIVSTNVGGIPYLLENGVDGILVSKNDHQKMAEEMIKLIETNNTLLMNNSRQKVENFSWDIVKNKWLKILNKELS